MPAASRRAVAMLLFATAFLAAAPTRADSGDVPLQLQLRDHLSLPVARALDMFFDATDHQQVTMRGFGAHVRHVVDLAAIRIWATPRLAVRMGAGFANLVDCEVACPAKSRGTAMSGSIYYAVLQPPGFALGVELSTLQVRYANAAGLNEGTVLFAFSSR